VAEDKPETIKLSPSCLAEWPKAFIEKMRDAVVAADLDRLLAQIQEVEVSNPKTAGILRRLAESFQYQKLLDALVTDTRMES